MAIASASTSIAELRRQLERMESHGSTAGVARCLSRGSARQTPPAAPSPGAHDLEEGDQFVVSVVENAAFPASRNVYLRSILRWRAFVNLTTWKIGSSSTST